jgi:hypothetical protein
MARRSSDEKMESEDWAVVVTVLLFLFAVALFALTGGSASSDFPVLGSRLDAASGHQNP